MQCPQVGGCFLSAGHPHPLPAFAPGCALILYLDLGCRGMGGNSGADNELGDAPQPKQRLRPPLALMTIVIIKAIIIFKKPKRGCPPLTVPAGGRAPRLPAAAAPGAGRGSPLPRWGAAQGGSACAAPSLLPSLPPPMPTCCRLCQRSLALWHPAGASGSGSSSCSSSSLGSGCCSGRTSPDGRVPRARGRRSPQVSPRCGKGGTDVQRGGMAERGTGDKCSLLSSPQGCSGDRSAREGASAPAPSYRVGSR